MKFTTKSWRVKIKERERKRVKHIVDRDAKDDNKTQMDWSEHIDLFNLTNFPTNTITD